MVIVFLFHMVNTGQMLNIIQTHMIQVHETGKQPEVFVGGQKLDWSTQLTMRL
jgi:hypothetical protein